MQGEIITIGNELTSGRALDLNAWYVAEKLASHGVPVTRITTVGDDPIRVSRAIKDAMGESDFVVVTGGLGSTDDDITNQIVAEALQRPLLLHREKFEQIKKHVEANGLRMSPSFEKMAWMPKDSQVFNPKEEMCGFSLVEGKVALYFLPGVPEQMRHLMDTYVLPEILSQYASQPVTRQRILKIYGLSEPEISEHLKNLSKTHPDLILGFYPHYPENHVSVSMNGKDLQTVAEEVERLEKEIRAALGQYIFGSDDDTLPGVAGKLLKEKGLTLSVAESCTGGLIGNLVTNVAGSSSYFMGGMVTYSNQAKIDMLQVDPQILADHGAVSEPTVRRMAEGVRAAFKSDLGLAVTGIAGPEGGSREKPVGTVHIGLASASGTFSQKYLFKGRRKQIKMNSAMMALDWARRFLCGYPFIPGL
ncbi:MAG: competence/damage-inducible protein A [Deltaproteobacteria bacterium HGW-Deltaproteobacteria-15]|jgi:nicotinamide-nucleotide amidase|nr:MAG: competence/damage-inducible protein A [Deltaproteobacteria bacterium HGW-Deltaproteobacteria-15]